MSFDVLIIDGNPERRMRLKGATASTPIFKDVQLCHAIPNAIEKLKGCRDRVVIFLNDDLPADSLASFIEIAKTTGGGRDSAYVLNVSQAKATDGKMLATALSGIDGVLLEPFSVDSLIQITKDSAEIYNKRRAERAKAAIGYLAKKILSELDAIAIAKRFEKAPGTHAQEIRALSQTVLTLGKEQVNAYFQHLEELTEIARVPSIVVEFYKRQQEAEAKVMARIQEKMAQSEAENGTEKATYHNAGSASAVRIVKKG